MAFIQPCFIRKNTPELRKKLEELGYKPNYAIEKHPQVFNNIGVCTFFGNFYYGVSDEEASRPGNIDDAIKNRGMIDCGDNENLFLALASMTDNEYGLCDYYIVTDDYNLRYTKGSIHRTLPISSNIHPSCYRKATVEELIEHFKKEENMETKLVKDLKKNDEVYCVFDDGETYILEVGEIYDHEHYNTIVFNRRNSGKSYTFDAGIFQCWICDEIGGAPIVIYLTKDDAIEALLDTIEKCKENIEMLK